MVHEGFWWQILQSVVHGPTYHYRWGDSRLSCNLEADDSELLETLGVSYVLHGLLSAGSNLQPHSGVVPVAKGLIYTIHVFILIGWHFQETHFVESSLEVFSHGKPFAFY